MQKTVQIKNCPIGQPKNDLDASSTYQAQTNTIAVVAGEILVGAAMKLPPEAQINLQMSPANAKDCKHLVSVNPNIIAILPKDQKD